jgi:cytoskeleton protein RodZ
MAFSPPPKPLLEDGAAGFDTAATGPLGVGGTLRRQREALGVDLADVAAALRIRPAYLMALEAGRPEELPAAVYANGFVRAYAAHLRLDAGGMLRRFKHASSLPATPDLAFPIPLGERSVPGGGFLIVALILATCAYGTWFYLSTGEGPRPERVAEVPLELLPKPGQPRARPATAQPAEDHAAAQPPAAPADAPEPPRPMEAGSGSARPSAATPTAAAAAEVPAAVSAAPAPDMAKGIVIRADADSWIEVRDARRSVLLARVLKAGESYHVPDQPGLSMRTGNAGGLEVVVNGVPAPSLGRIGMVRRNIALDAQALLAGNAVRD